MITNKKKNLVQKDGPDMQCKSPVYRAKQGLNKFLVEK